MHVKAFLLRKAKHHKEVDEHQDSCRFTLIIYLDKSPGIRDEFWVGDRKITQNVWSKNNRFIQRA